jgi:hypothetical protein
MTADRWDQLIAMLAVPLQVLLKANLLAHLLPCPPPDRIMIP